MREYIDLLVFSFCYFAMFIPKKQGKTL